MIIRSCESPETKPLLADGRPESAAVDSEQMPAAPGREAERFDAYESETPEATDEVDGHDGEEAVALELTTLDDAVGADAIDQSEGCGVVDNPAAGDSEDAGEPDEATAAGCQPGSDTSPEGNPDDEAEAADDDGEEIDLPQPLSFVELPADFDWRKLKPRVYGKSLPALDPVDLQSLEHSIVSRGILHKILIDELSNVIDGNTRCEICTKRGIVPPVEMVAGLTEVDKEELALSSNLARRQMKDPDVERRVREARLENMFTGREKSPKKFTLKRIARAIGLSVATVSLRWRERQNSQGENASIADARQLYGDDLKSEAVRLVKMGMPVADVSRLLPISRKAVERAVKKEKDRPARDKAKRGKGKKKTPARRKEPIEDHADNYGVPELHQRALEHLDQDAQDYDGLHKLAAGQAREAVGEISGSVADLLYYAIYGRKLTAVADAQLEELLSAGGEEDAVEGDAAEEESMVTPGPSAGEYELGEILSGTVLVIEPDEVLVELPNGNRGVIGASDEGLTWHGQPDEGEEVQVEVNGFDSERELFELGLVDRDPMSEDESVDFVEPDLDDLSPYERHFGGGEGSEE